jgi:hypothetical protein
MENVALKLSMYGAESVYIKFSDIFEKNFMFEYRWDLTISLLTIAIVIFIIAYRKKRWERIKGERKKVL